MDNISNALYYRRGLLGTFENLSEVVPANFTEFFSIFPNNFHNSFEFIC